MAEVEVTEPAIADIAAILEHLEARAGRTIADRYTQGFIDAYDRLAQFPEQGAPRPRLGMDVRLLMVPPYNLLYRYDGNLDLVRVLRVLHGRRKISRKMVP
ncbi:MAG TPA: hypothetical protein DCL54_10895 [Alphaproteobacteria bacterium]|nr:hypothetical protein [Alphaproteobacteria bacterium]HAJ47076.1 hypothetical protein [Alphaproteobacteria bacterium]